MWGVCIASSLNNWYFSIWLLFWKILRFLHLFLLPTLLNKFKKSSFKIFIHSAGKTPSLTLLRFSWFSRTILVIVYFFVRMFFNYKFLSVSCHIKVFTMNSLVFPVTRSKVLILAGFWSFLTFLKLSILTQTLRLGHWYFPRHYTVHSFLWVIKCCL